MEGAGAEGDQRGARQVHPACQTRVGRLRHGRSVRADLKVGPYRRIDPATPMPPGITIGFTDTRCGPWPKLAARPETIPTAVPKITSDAQCWLSTMRERLTYP